MPPKDRPAMHKKTKQIRHMKFYTHLHLLMACSNNGLRKLLKSRIPWKMESNLALSTDITFLNSFSNFITIFLNCLLKFSLNHLQIYEIIYNSFLFDGDILRNFTVISLFHFHQELKWIDLSKSLFPLHDGTRIWKYSLWGVQKNKVSFAKIIEKCKFEVKSRNITIENYYIS